MGFYSPAVLVKDAQRHGLRIKPIDVQRSEWACTIEHDGEKLRLRMGLGYAKGLRKRTVETLVEERKRGLFRSVEDLALRVPLLDKRELVRLAGVGALNPIENVEHRRDALWQVERAGKLEGPLLRQNSNLLVEDSGGLPLAQMDTQERLVADYDGTGLTTGHYPMHYRRDELRKQGIHTAEELKCVRDGARVVSAGCVIARQRPGTAKGFIFISMEDETGIANVIVTPDLYEQYRVVVTRARFLYVEGKLQNQDGVIHIKVHHLAPLADGDLMMTSHDFH